MAHYQANLVIIYYRIWAEKSVEKGSLFGRFEDNHLKIPKFDSFKKNSSRRNYSRKYGRSINLNVETHGNKSEKCFHIWVFKMPQVCQNLAFLKNILRTYLCTTTELLQSWLQHFYHWKQHDWICEN